MKINHQRVRLLILVLLFWLQTLGVVSYAVTNTAETQTALAENDQQLEQILDEMLGEDPTIIDDAEILIKVPGAPPQTACCEISLGAGYQSNVLNSGLLELNSNLLQTTVDFGFSTGTETLNLWSFYAFYKQVALLDVEVTEPKRLFLVRVQNKRAINPHSFWGFNTEYFYTTTFDRLNAVEDKPLPVTKNQELSVSPFWETVWGERFSLLVALPVARFQTDEPADVYNSIGLAGALKKQYHHQSELQIRFKTEQRRYPDGEILDLSGAAVAGTQLQLDINSVGLHNVHYGQEKSQWRVESDLELKTQRDNGEGYDNYDTVYATIGFYNPISQWNLGGKAAAGVMQYIERTVETTDNKTEKMVIRTIDVGIEVEKKLGSNAYLKAEVANVRSESNSKIDDYSSTSFVLTAAVLF